LSGRSFIKGLLTGGVIGAVASMVIAPQFMGEPSCKMLGKTRKMQHRASRIYREVRDGVSELVKK